MLDTHGRKYVNSIIDKFASFLLRLHITPNQVTVAAFIIGIFSSVFVYFDRVFFAFLFLWFSGFLDAVDGAMARKKNNSTSWGTLMDITFDRVVEIGLIIALALKYEKAIFYLLILTCCIIFSMTIFLTVGALADKNGVKSFYYQAGVAERTEGFILFTCMILFKEHIIFITNLFSMLVLITALQRMREGKKMFSMRK